MLLCSIISHVCFLRSVLAEPSGQDLLQPSYQSSLNNSTSLGAIDTRFTVQGRYTNVRIPATSCLMNSVTYLVDVSSFGWNSPVHVSRHARFTQYTNVEIDVETVTVGDLSTRFLVWAVYLAISDMTIRRRFFAVEFDVKWKGNVIAWLRFQPPSAPGGSTGLLVASSDDMTASPTGVVSRNSNSTAINTAGQIITTNNTDFGDPEFGFYIDFTPQAKTLSIFEVFMTVIATMVENAMSDANARVQPFQVSAPGFGTEMEITKDPRLPRRRPPFFEHKWVTEAMAQIPTFMLIRGRFAEVNFDIELNDVPVGGGTLLQKAGVTSA